MGISKLQSQIWISLILKNSIKLIPPQGDEGKVKTGVTAEVKGFVDCFLCDLISNMASVVHELRHHRRSYRPREHVELPYLLQQYSNEELYARYRFRKDDISYLCSVLRPYLKRQTMRSHAL